MQQSNDIVETYTIQIQQTMRILADDIFFNLQQQIDNRKVFVMFEGLLSCDPASDHLLPKSLLPLYYDFLQEAQDKLQNVQQALIQTKLNNFTDTVLQSEIKQKQILFDEIQSLQVQYFQQTQLTAQSSDQFQHLQKQFLRQLKENIVNRENATEKNYQKMSIGNVFKGDFDDKVQMPQKQSKNDIVKGLQQTLSKLQTTSDEKLKDLSEQILKLNIENQKFKQKMKEIDFIHQQELEAVKSLQNIEPYNDIAVYSANVTDSQDGNQLKVYQNKIRQLESDLYDSKEKSKILQDTLFVKEKLINMSLKINNKLGQITKSKKLIQINQPLLSKQDNQNCAQSPQTDVQLQMQFNQLSQLKQQIDQLELENIELKGYSKNKQFNIDQIIMPTKQISDSSFLHFVNDDNLTSELSTNSNLNTQQNISEEHTENQICNHPIIITKLQEEIKELKESNSNLVNMIMNLKSGDQNKVQQMKNAPQQQLTSYQQQNVIKSSEKTQINNQPQSNNQNNNNFNQYFENNIQRNNQNTLHGSLNQNKQCEVLTEQFQPDGQPNNISQYQSNENNSLNNAYQQNLYQGVNNANTLQYQQQLNQNSGYQLDCQAETQSNILSKLQSPNHETTYNNQCIDHQLLKSNANNKNNNFTNILSDNQVTFNSKSLDINSLQQSTISHIGLGDTQDKDAFPKDYNQYSLFSKNSQRPDETMRLFSDSDNDGLFMFNEDLMKTIECSEDEQIYNDDNNPNVVKLLEKNHELVEQVKRLKSKLLEIKQNYYEQQQKSVLSDTQINAENPDQYIDSQCYFEHILNEQNELIQEIIKNDFKNQIQDKLQPIILPSSAIIINTEDDLDERQVKLLKIQQNSFGLEVFVNPTISELSSLAQKNIYDFDPSIVDKNNITDQLKLIQVPALPKQPIPTGSEQSQLLIQDYIRIYAPHINMNLYTKQGVAKKSSFKSSNSNNSLQSQHKPKPIQQLKPSKPIQTLKTKKQTQSQQTKLDDNFLLDKHTAQRDYDNPNKKFAEPQNRPTCSPNIEETKEQPINIINFPLQTRIFTKFIAKIFGVQIDQSPQELETLLQSRLQTLLQASQNTITAHVSQIADLQDKVYAVSLAQSRILQQHNQAVQVGFEAQETDISADQISYYIRPILVNLNVPYSSSLSKADMLSKLQRVQKDLKSRISDKEAQFRERQEMQFQIICMQPPQASHVAPRPLLMRLDGRNWNSYFRRSNAAQRGVLPELMERSMVVSSLK
ncbi:hypothetical protein SS50377_26861 [Spironucleus salmonicida]|nr:hypothetical protein SS50377_26861 [Spironucleus salmonicida]